MERPALERIARGSDLSLAELSALREIVANSFMSRNAVAPAPRSRLLALGLISQAMGGLVVTPAGRIVARM